ncbi:phosphoribosylanthranilate isomerase [Sphingomonas sp. NBWT7]|uniref:phosphoribosylanthranilate isomerase n=1 Tax=Sphingomonas sp. NBWT7 TaxID=2596913 RepID=UPI001627CD07|nr:phosphoribosylanthranilate isomerase [Sphingomonas sp. NBWT7]QNE31156.1 phosphoribosylanthranilate isomerase [Sphingomonas sp. NBWT7]
MTQAKVCGLSTHPTIEAAVANGASHLGFVFFPPSPRAVGFDQASDLCRAIPGHVARVGVFVDPDDALIERAIGAAGLTVLQLHKTAPARVAHLRQSTGLETWAAVAVKTHGDVAQASAYDGAASAILFDAKTPDDAALPGGMGVRFDWSLLNGHRHTMPWGLSGGLDAGNVGEAIRRTGAPLVDASSGLETAPGIKNVDKITAFLQSVAAS